MSHGSARGLSIDTDATLAANSDLMAPSQKAIKSYITNLNVATGGGTCTGTNTGDQTLRLETSPTQISSNQNDYSFTTGTTHLRLTSDADGRQITGMAGGVAGFLLCITNIGSYDLLFKHQDTSSTAANRLVLPYGVHFVLRPGDTYTFVYDGTTARWRLVGGYDNFLRDPNFCTVVIEDFIGGSNANNTLGALNWQVAGSGTSTRPTPEAGYPGLIDVNASTAGTDRSMVHGSLSNIPYSTLSSADQIVWSARIKLPTLSDAVQEYYCAIGLSDLYGTVVSKISALTNSLIGFEYDRTVSTNWYRVTSSLTSGAATQASTGVAVGTGYIDLGFVLDVATPTVTFYLNGASVGTHTTNLPTGANDYLSPTFYMYKTVGNTLRGMRVDYMRMLTIRTAKRNTSGSIP